MPVDPEARARLTSLIEEKRLDLGITLREFTDRAGISYEALRNFRSGSGSLRPLTQRKIETALGWPAGAVGRVLAGEQEIRPKIPPNILAAVRRELDPEAQERVLRAIERVLTGETGDDPDVTPHGPLRQPPGPSAPVRADAQREIAASLSPPPGTPAPPGQSALPA